MFFYLVLLFYLFNFIPLSFFLFVMTNRTVSSPVIPDPNNSSVRILALGVEGPNETSRLSKLGSRTFSGRKLFEHLQNHKYRGQYGLMLERLRPDGSIIIIA